MAHGYGSVGVGDSRGVSHVIECLPMGSTMGAQAAHQPVARLRSPTEVFALLVWTHMCDHLAVRNT